MNVKASIYNIKYSPKLSCNSSYLVDICLGSEAEAANMFLIQLLHSKVKFGRVVPVQSRVSLTDLPRLPDKLIQRLVSRETEGEVKGHTA